MMGLLLKNCFRKNNRWVNTLLAGALVVSCSGDLSVEQADFCASRRNFRGIVNGVVTSSWPSVIKISTYGGSCTATVVSDSTIITAGHCVTSGGNSISYNGTYGLSAVSTTNNIDLAVVVFPEGTFGEGRAELLQRPPQINDSITIVGYGQTDFVNNNRTDGNKRVGCNSVTAFANVSGKWIVHQTTPSNFIHYRSPIYATDPEGEESMTGRGDSGGPVFIDGKLAAVTNFGGTQTSLAYRISGDTSPDRTALYEYDTNLTSAAAKELLRRAQYEIGAKIPNL